MKFTREITICPTPDELALCFTEWDSEDQAKFFNTVAARMREWPPHARVMQCAYIREHLERSNGVQWDASELLAELSPMFEGS